MTAPLTVEIELKELLIELKQSIKDLDTKQDQRFNALEAKTDQRFNALEAKTDQRFNTLENKIENLTKTVTILSEKFDGLDKRVNKLENTQTTQLWALIALLIGAFVKFGFFPNI
jgi:predicted nuclease with TOPRIM domain